MTARHVGFVERREDRGVLLSREQAFGDALADRASSARASRDRPPGQVRRAASRRSDPGGGSTARCCCAARLDSLSTEASTSSLMTRPPRPVPVNLCGINALVGRHLARRSATASARARGRSGTRGRAAGTSARPSGGGSRVCGARRGEPAGSTGRSPRRSATRVCPSVRPMRQHAGGGSGRPPSWPCRFPVRRRVHSPCTVRRSA